MDDRLVSDCNQILHLLLNGNTHVNDIIKGTSLPKKRVFTANDFLESIKLINKTNHPKHKQKILVSLTDFGKHFAKLIVNFEKFDESLQNINMVIKQFNSYSHLDKNARKNILAYNKWKEHEIKNYDLHLGYINELEIDFLDIIINVIEHIYTYILTIFTPDKEAKDYMNYLFSNKIIYYLQNKVEKTIPDEIQATCKKCNNDMTQQIHSEHKVEEIYIEMSDRLFDSIDDYMKCLFSHTLVSKEIKNLIISTVDLMNLPKKFLDQKIKDMEESSIEDSEENDKYKENIKPLKSFYQSLSQRI